MLWKWTIFSFRKNVSGIQTCKIKSFFIMRTAKNRIRCCMKGCFCIKECCGNGKFYHSRKTFPASTPAKWRDVLFRGQPMTALVVARKYCFQNGNIFVLVKLIRHKQMENWDIFYADSQRPHYSSWSKKHIVSVLYKEITSFSTFSVPEKVIQYAILCIEK